MSNFADSSDRFRFIAAGAGAIAAGIGGYHLYAWLSGAMTYRGFHHITMKTNAALCLLLAAVALIVVALGRETRLQRGIIRALAVVVMTIGILTLLEHLVGWDLGIDQLLAFEPAGAVGILHPNRMGPPGAATYAIGGAAILLILHRRERAVRAAQWLATVICLVALMGILGYLYGVKDLFGAVRYTVIAFPATIGNFFFGVGLLVARPRDGLMKRVMSSDPGGTSLRRLLPAAVLLPIVLGWLRLQGEWHGFYERYFGTALLILSLIVTFSFLIYTTAKRISRAAEAETRAREEVLVQRQLLDSIIASIPAGVLLARAYDLRILFVNEQYKAFAPGKEMLGRTIEEVWPEIQPWFGDIQRTVAATGIPYHTVDDRILLTRSHGAPLEERYFTWSTVRVSLSETEEWGILITVWETTERKRNEEQLETARDLLQGVMEGAASNIAAVDNAFRFLALNRAYRHAFAEVFGVEAEVGDRLEDLLAHLPEQRTTAMAVWQRALQGETFVVEEEFGLSGRRRYFEIRFGPIEDHDGRIVGATQISTDITGRKEAEEALRQSEMRFRAVFEQAAVGIARVSFTDARWLDVNPAFRRMLGYSLEEMRATPWPQITHPEDVDLDLVPFRRMAAGDLENYTVEKRFIHKEGHHVWARLTLSLVRDPEGLPDYEIAVIEDITERKCAEIRLAESERRFRGIFENAAVGISLFDRSGRLMAANAKLCQILGQTAETLRGVTFGSFTHLDDLEPDLSNYQSMMSDGLESYSLEKRYRRNDGSFVWVRVTRSAQRDNGGMAQYSINIVEDISDRKEAENRLRQTATLLRAVTESTPDFIFVKDRQGRMLMANPATLKDLGKTPEEVLGRTDAEFLGGEGGERIMENDRRVMELGETLVVEEIPHPEGNRRVYLSSKTPYLDENGKVFGLIGISRDITDLKRSGEERERLLAEVQRSNQDLQQFAYVASHDLQEPLRMVSGYMQLLDRRYKEQLDEKAKTYINFAVDGTKRMQDLIEGLLRYSRISTEKKRAAVDTNSIAATAIANLEPSIRESGGQVTTDHLPTVQGDETQLLQLFQNLIGNGLKYRKPGVAPQVHISARQEGDEWVFAVQDNGIGIAPEHFEKVFQIFQRLHTKEEYPGTGIGLASCKKIVERHGGRIWLESTPGEGSIFRFSIPSRGYQ